MDKCPHPLELAIDILASHGHVSAYRLHVQHCVVCCFVSRDLIERYRKTGIRYHKCLAAPYFVQYYLLDDFAERRQTDPYLRVFEPHRLNCIRCFQLIPVGNATPVLSAITTGGYSFS